MLHLFNMAIRDLGRNRRRSFFSGLALAAGLALLLMIASVINGEVQGAMETSIKLQSGHLQVRATSFDDATNSLAYEDLLTNPDAITTQLTGLSQVRVATPRLFAAGFITLSDQSFGVRMMGIDPASPANDPFRAGMISGQFLQADDRDGVLIGQLLANKLSVKTGDTIHLVVNTSNGDMDDQIFTVRGTYTTHTPSYDKTTVLLPLAKAQTITRTENHASTIFVMLKDRNDAALVAAAIPVGQYQVKTWQQLNDLLIQTEKLYSGYMVILYLIVLGITATVIVNTLIMAVFERTREIGILSAIGMKSGRIMAMFFAESTLLAIGGILMGLLLGGMLVAYFTVYGIPLGDYGLSSGSGSMLLGDAIYASLTVSDAVGLTAAAFIITLLAGVYPAVLAARMEPVQALRGGK